MNILKWCVIMILIGGGYLFGQTLDVTVSVEYSHLTDDQQKELDGFADKIEQYYDNFDWTDNDYDTDIPCNVKIIIETVQKKTFEKMYKAQFLISSESGESFYDKIWEFPYQPSTPLNHAKGQFDPLSHFLDFYAHMILAGELDTYGLLLGTPEYDKALDIANQGLLSQYSRGWHGRIEILQKITQIRTRPLREVKPDFFEALERYDDGDYKGAYKLTLKVLEGIQKEYNFQPNNYYLRIFFDAHNRDMAMLLSCHEDNLRAMLDIDSKHRDAYREYLPSEK